MPIKYLNESGINLPMAVWLLNDRYDHVDGEDYVSATRLLKPLRELVLSDRNKDSKATTEIDIANLAQSQDGTAMHDAIEGSWGNKRAVREACQLVGLSENIIRSLVVNPTPEMFAHAKSIGRMITPVYMENRTIREIDGYRVGGKYDLVLAGELHDYKKTGTFTYTHQTNAKKYIQQGSIYRWLNPTIITGDTLTINYYFTDWVEYRKTTLNYPPQRIMSQQFELKSLEETELFIKTVLKGFTHYKNNPTEELPLCTPEELWMGDPEYKYFKNPTAARATKNFGTDAAGANALLAKNGCGIVKTVPAMAKACKYCSAAPYCDQAANLIKNKQLVL